MSETKPKLTMGQMIEKYLALRDKAATLKKLQTETMAPYNVAMSTLENMLLGELNASGQKSANTPAGTAYKTTSTSAKVVDWTETLAYIREHDAWDLLEHRVSKLAVGALIEETQQPVPGVSVTTETVVNVRKA
jgi:hypothetical protein